MESPTASLRWQDWSDRWTTLDDATAQKSRASISSESDSRRSARSSSGIREASSRQHFGQPQSRFPLIVTAAQRQRDFSTDRLHEVMREIAPAHLRGLNPI